MQAVEIFRLIVLAGMLCWATYSDLKQETIPNLLSLLGTVVGIALAIGIAENPIDGLIFSLSGILAGAGPFLIFYWIGRALRKPLMGGGDVKLMAAIGAFVGAEGALWCIYYGMMVAGAAAVGILIFYGLSGRKRPKTIALGACLAIGTMYWVARHEGKIDSPELPPAAAASEF